MGLLFYVWNEKWWIERRTDRQTETSQTQTIRTKTRFGHKWLERTCTQLRSHLRSLNFETAVRNRKRFSLLVQAVDVQFNTRWTSFDGFLTISRSIYYAITLHTDTASFVTHREKCNPFTNNTFIPSPFRDAGINHLLRPKYRSKIPSSLGTYSYVLGYFKSI